MSLVPAAVRSRPGRHRATLAVTGAAVLGCLSTTVVAAGTPASGAAAPARSATTVRSSTAAAATQYGKVTFVDDGDTVDVDIVGDGSKRSSRIRYIGVQAMELTRYSHTLSKIRGECWGVAATRYLHSLVDGKRVQLTAQHSGSHAGGRARRHVAVQINGVWQDTGQLLINAGLALPDLIPNEWSHNAAYLAGAQQAAANRVGMWGDPSHCGAGPAAGATLGVHVHWDAAGNDGRNVNGEWIDIRNNGSHPVSLAGWWVRDAAYRGVKAHGYRFPRGTTVAPGKRVRVKVGHGGRTSRVQHWGLSAPAFANVTGAPRWMGDGAWLFDRDGDLRAWDMYPG